MHTPNCEHYKLRRRTYLIVEGSGIALSSKQGYTSLARSTDMMSLLAGVFRSGVQFTRRRSIHLESGACLQPVTQDLEVLSQPKVGAIVKMRLGSTPLQLQCGDGTAD